MRSIADAEVKKARKRPRNDSITGYGDQEDSADDPTDRNPTPEKYVELKQFTRKVLALFDDDPQARQIVVGRMKDLTADETARADRARQDRIRHQNAD